MRNDKQKLMELFNELGIIFEEDEDSITVTKGYSGFFFDFVFDDNGKLIKYGAWE